MFVAALRGDDVVDSDDDPVADLVGAVDEANVTVGCTPSNEGDMVAEVLELVVLEGDDIDAVTEPFSSEMT